MDAHDRKEHDGDRKHLNLIKQGNTQYKEAQRIIGIQELVKKRAEIDARYAFAQRLEQMNAENYIDVQTRIIGKNLIN